MTTKTPAAKIAAKLRRRGFDRTTSCAPHVRPRCSQCEVMVINGVACHETGCTNSRVTN